MPLAEPDDLERPPWRACAAPPSSSCLAAVVEQRQLDVVERRRPRQQVEALEDEADLACCGRAPVRPSTSCDTSLPSRMYVPLVGRSRQPTMCMKRRLAGARRTGDRDELARFDVERRHRAARGPRCRRRGRSCQIPNRYDSHGFTLTDAGRLEAASAAAAAVPASRAAAALRPASAGSVRRRLRQRVTSPPSAGSHWSRLRCRAAAHRSITSVYVPSEIPRRR